MSRCRISKPSTLKKLSAIVGEPVETALTRNHRIAVWVMGDRDQKYTLWPKRGGYEVEDTRQANREQAERVAQACQLDWNRCGIDGCEGHFAPTGSTKG